MTEGAAVSGLGGMPEWLRKGQDHLAEVESAALHARVRDERASAEREFARRRAAGEKFGEWLTKNFRERMLNECPREQQPDVSAALDDLEWFESAEKPQSEAQSRNSGREAADFTAVLPDTEYVVHARADWPITDGGGGREFERGEVKFRVDDTDALQQRGWPRGDDLVTDYLSFQRSVARILGEAEVAAAPPVFRFELKAVDLPEGYAPYSDYADRNSICSLGTGECVLRRNGHSEYEWVAVTASNTEAIGSESMLRELLRAFWVEQETAPLEITLPSKTTLIIPPGRWPMLRIDPQNRS